MEAEIKDIIDLYVNKNKTATEIAKLHKCTTKTILNRLRRNNVEIKNSGHWHKKVELEQIRYEYEILGFSTVQIAKKYNMNPVSIWERLKKNGVKIKDQKEAVFEYNHKISLSEYKKICDLYLNDKTQNCGKIAKIYNVHKTTISAILKKNGIVLENKGARLNYYKGGITPLHNKIRNCPKYFDWRTRCFKRDNYICTISGVKEKLNVHHIKSFSSIFKEFLQDHSEITNQDVLFGLALDYKLFWDIDNGITMSENIHKYLHKNQIDLALGKSIKVLYDSGWNRNKISKYLNLSWHKVNRIINLCIKY